jgi:hypothetical protein
VSGASYVAEPDPAFIVSNEPSPWRVRAWKPEEPPWTVCQGMTEEEARACEAALRGTSGAAPVFVVILEDRHVDPAVSVHRTLDGARAKVVEHKARYREHRSQYVWSTMKHAGRDVVHLEITDCDDGPSLRIERTELGP